MKVYVFLVIIKIRVINNYRLLSWEIIIFPIGYRYVQNYSFSLLVLYLIETTNYPISSSYYFYKRKGPKN